MSTNLQIITDSLRALNVLDETETASADQGTHCLRQLNQMLAAWEVEGVPLGYFAQTSTADTCPIPDWAETGVYGMLAIRVAGHFSAQIPAATISLADMGYQTILRTITNQKLQGLDMSHMGLGSGQGQFTDITTL